jgi:spore coat polysaccharide biosynthesis protein SpsF
MIVAILQARMSSRRLPGKVLLPIGGRPILDLQIERLLRCRAVDRLVVATSTHSDDDAIAANCARLAVTCRRGPLNDVLERFRLAAETDTAAHVVRLTADCPLADWRVIDALVALHLAGRYDFTTNARPRTFPHGLDCEIMTRDALLRAASEAVSEHEREHVTPYLYRADSGLRVGRLTCPLDLSFLRWTVDTLEDFRFVEAVYNELYESTPDFAADDVLELQFKRPSLRFMNASAQAPEDRRKAALFWETRGTRSVVSHRVMSTLVVVDKGPCD